MDRQTDLLNTTHYQIILCHAILEDIVPHELINLHITTGTVNYGGLFVSLFRLFAWQYFVLAPRHDARRKDERTKWHKQATIVNLCLTICIET